MTKLEKKQLEAAKTKAEWYLENSSFSEGLNSTLSKLIDELAGDEDGMTYYQVRENLTTNHYLDIVRELSEPNHYSFFTWENEEFTIHTYDTSGFNEYKRDLHIAALGKILY